LIRNQADARVTKHWRLPQKGAKLAILKRFSGLPIAEKI
jgi:hypothetical protein